MGTKFIDTTQLGKLKKVETIFTHRQHTSGWIETECEPKEYEEVKYLGKCITDGDMFACHYNGIISIFKGIKGDEFD